jgi:hypothetical protein
MKITLIDLACELYGWPPGSRGDVTRLRGDDTRLRGDISSVLPRGVELLPGNKGIKN